LQHSHVAPTFTFRHLFPDHIATSFFQRLAIAIDLTVPCRGMSRNRDCSEQQSNQERLHVDLQVQLIDARPTAASRALFCEIFMNDALRVEWRSARLKGA
jgi:hypothetical protein